MYYAMDNLGGYNGEFDGENVLCSAGTAWNNPGDGFALAVPDNPASVFVDSGGYQVSAGWNLQYPTAGGRTLSGPSQSELITLLSPMRRVSRRSIQRNRSTASITRYSGSGTPIKSIGTGNGHLRWFRYCRDGHHKNIACAPVGWTVTGSEASTPPSEPSANAPEQTPSVTFSRRLRMNGLRQNGIYSGLRSTHGRTTVSRAGFGQQTRPHGTGAHPIRKIRNGCTENTSRRLKAHGGATDKRCCDE